MTLHSIYAVLQKVVKIEQWRSTKLKSLTMTSKIEWYFYKCATTAKINDNNNEKKIQS